MEEPKEENEEDNEAKKKVLDRLLKSKTNN